MTVVVLPPERNRTEGHIDAPHPPGVTHIGASALFTMSVDLLVRNEVCYCRGGENSLNTGAPAVSSLRTNLI